VLYLWFGVEKARRLEVLYLWFGVQKARRLRGTIKYYICGLVYKRNTTARLLSVIQGVRILVCHSERGGAAPKDK